MTHGRPPRRMRASRSQSLGAPTPLDIALCLNSPLTAREQGLLGKALANCMHHLRRVTYNDNHLLALNTFWLIANSIDERGPVKGFGLQIEAALNAIASVRDRCGGQAAVDNGTWRACACTGPELTALDDMGHWFLFIARHVTYGEFTEHSRRTTHRVRSVGGSVGSQSLQSLGLLEDVPA